MRLILVPQYPTKLRYQEWWIREFVERYCQYFDEVKVLGPIVLPEKASEGSFSPVQASVDYELKQISKFMSLKLLPDDILLLNDLSFPGLFAPALIHKRPKRCFAICHATSKSKYDLFQPIRNIKYPMEKISTKLFDGIFVGTKYHAKKLGWKNLYVTKLPNYPVWMQPEAPKKRKKRLFVSVSRPSIQKVTRKIEKAIERKYQTKILRPNVASWEEYFAFLQESRFLLITSKEETYGYQVIDAIMNGCIPLAPKAYSYPELIPNNFLYSSYYELTKLIDYWKTHTPILTLPKESFFRTTTRIMQGETNK
jgi:hypothetical protein